MDIPRVFGQENKDYITKAYLRKIILGHSRSVSTLIKHIHFNPEHPENHNIKICDADSNMFTVHDELGWRNLHKEYVLDTLVMNYWKHMVQFYEGLNKKEFKNQLISVETSNKIERFVSDFKTMSIETLKDIKVDVHNTILYSFKEYDKFVLLSDTESE